VLCFFRCIAFLSYFLLFFICFFLHSWLSTSGVLRIGKLSTCISSYFIPRMKFWRSSGLVCWKISCCLLVYVRRQPSDHWDLHDDDLIQFLRN
jgi:hypothetical protein